MEEALPLPSISVVLPSILLFLLIIIVKRGFSKSRSRHRKLPPGPWKLPFLGSMHHLAGQLPFHAFRDLAAQHSPLKHLKIGQVDLAVASSPAAAEEIVKNQDLNFASARIAGYLCSGIAFCPFGPYWKQLHKLCFVELLSTSRIQSFASIRKEESRRLMSDISTSSWTTIKMSEKLSTLTNKIVSRAAFGRGNAHPEPILATIREALDLVLGFYFADVFPSLSFLDYLPGANFKLRRLHRQFDAVLSAIIEEHEANGRDSNEVQHIVDVLLRVKDDPELEIPMTMDNVKAVILQTGDVLGYDIRAGTKVCIDAWAIGRDPRHWDAADSFMPERFEEGSVDFKGSDFQYLPFGGGRRMCPGAAFALATMKLTLAQLLYFDWELPEGMKPEELDMSEGFGLVAARKTELKLLATPRVPLPSAV